MNSPHNQILSNTKKAGSSLANCDFVSETQKSTSLETIKTI